MSLLYKQDRYDINNVSQSSSQQHETSRFAWHWYKHHRISHTKKQHYNFINRKLHKHHSLCSISTAIPPTIAPWLRIHHHHEYHLIEMFPTTTGIAATQHQQRQLEKRCESDGIRNGIDVFDAACSSYNTWLSFSNGCRVWNHIMREI